MSARFLLAVVVPLLVLGCSRPPPPASTATAGPTVDVDAEFARLRATLAQEVPGAIADLPEAGQHWAGLAQRAIAARGQAIRRPQLVMVVDRNPAVQEMRLVLARPSGPWRSMGGTRVSTGQEGRHGYFITPTGVFPHTDAILDWRAEGTFNANGIRGLGLRGMRVWDFGWQAAERGWDADGSTAEIRLLVHATDPDTLEQRLGRPASKGCVRVPGPMNVFLDRHGILDSDYEAAAKADPRYEAVLRPDRTPTPLAGNMLVIVDSAQGPMAAAQPR
ncbi:L,D-transpeptidase [Inquilinus sp.]|uniref:L,D-transpeptidase n=1 Tax=Inquilinus sp. TaxID=1932117 RepID=UPI0031E1731A